MKAIQVQSTGGPEVLKLKEVPRPQINADDVLVKVYASGVNPIDWKVREGYMKHHLIENFAVTVAETFTTIKSKWMISNRYAISISHLKRTAGF